MQTVIHVKGRRGGQERSVSMLLPPYYVDMPPIASNFSPYVPPTHIYGIFFSIQSTLPFSLWLF